MVIHVLLSKNTEAVAKISLHVCIAFG